MTYVFVLGRRAAQAGDLGAITGSGATDVAPTAG
jgi:hypothetical protein